MHSGGSDNLAEGALEHLVEKAVQRALVNIMESYGFDASTHEGRQELREVFTWARDARNGTALVRKTATLAIVTTFISGAAFGLWTMLVWIASLGKHP